MNPLATGTRHLDNLRVGLNALYDAAPAIDRWAERLVLVLTRGGRLLTAGNGGSAAEAQHLTAELVGRYRDDRPAYSAIALHADTSSLTAIGNDYGYDEVFARQVRAHGRPRDVFLALSTSGRSPNLVRAAETARDHGLTVWSMTGAAPNPLAEASEECICLPGPSATVQELQLVAVHLLCAAFDVAVGAADPQLPEPYPLELAGSA